MKQVEFTGAPRTEWVMPDQNTGNFITSSLWIVCGSFNVQQLFKGCETRPPAYSPYPRRLESLTICWCNYKGSTFYSVILRPWVLVGPESNSRPPALQPNAQPTEPPARGMFSAVKPQRERELYLFPLQRKIGSSNVILVRISCFPDACVCRRELSNN